MDQERIVRKPEQKKLTGLSSTQTDRLEREGRFPKRRQITERIVGWSYLEIQAWIQNRLHGDSEPQK